MLLLTVYTHIHTHTHSHTLPRPPHTHTPTHSLTGAQKEGGGPNVFMREALNLVDFFVSNYVTQDVDLANLEVRTLRHYLLSSLVFLYFLIFFWDSTCHFFCYSLVIVLLFSCYFSSLFFLLFSCCFLTMKILSLIFSILLLLTFTSQSMPVTAVGVVPEKELTGESPLHLIDAWLLLNSKQNAKSSDF